MTDYAWPTDLMPVVQSFWLQPHVGRSESPFTRQQKLYGLSAPRWVSRASFRGGYDGADGIGAWGGWLDGLIAMLDGGVVRVTFWDFRRPTRTGSGATLENSGLVGTLQQFTDGFKFTDGKKFATTWAGGPPTNDAAAIGATTITWRGFTALTQAFNVGDYVGGDGRPHITTPGGAPVVGGDGSVTVTFTPPLAAAILAGAASYTRVSGTFRLTADDAGSNPTEVGQMTGYDLELVEDL